MNILNSNNPILMIVVIGAALAMLFNGRSKLKAVKNFLSVRYRDLRIKARNINNVTFLIGGAVFLFYENPDWFAKNEQEKTVKHQPDVPATDTSSRTRIDSNNQGLTNQRYTPVQFGKAPKPTEMILPLNEAMSFDDGEIIVRSVGNTLYFAGNVIGVGENPWEINDAKSATVSAGHQIHVTTSKKSWRSNILKTYPAIVMADTVAFLKPASSPKRQLRKSQPSKIQPPKESKSDTVYHIHQFVVSREVIPKQSAQREYQ